jgi:hypothetical protein
MSPNPLLSSSRAQSLDELLRACTVRLSTPTGAVGTGFFVAKGLVLTCAHVVRGPTGRASAVTVEWAGHSNTVAPKDVQLQPDPCPQKDVFPDLALVRVPWEDHPCVWLHPDVRLGERLYTWGYPATRRDGDSVTGGYEGPTKYGQTGAHELLKFKDGQVWPGISGSPLLNRDTGAVCGVVKRTRGESTDLGGFAVQIQTVFDCFPDLVDGQKEYHVRDNTWSDLRCDVTRHPEEDGLGAPSDVPLLAESLRKYLEALIQQLEETPWFCRGRRLRVGEIAIPVRVLKEIASPKKEEEKAERVRPPLADSALAAVYEDPAGSRRVQQVPWEEEMRQGKRVVVLGGPGGGKSFLTALSVLALAREALTQLEHGTPLGNLSIPVHLSLSRFARGEWPQNPATVLLQALRDDKGLPAELAKWLISRLQKADSWLVLDGLDQVTQTGRGPLRAWLKALAHRRWRCRILLTCRTATYDRSWVPWDSVAEYTLAPFGHREIRKLVRHWFGAEDAQGRELLHALDANYALAHGCRNPMIATLTCLAHEAAGVTASARRVELYGKVLRAVVAREWQDDSLERNDAHIGDMIELLESVARMLVERDASTTSFTNAEIINAIRASPVQPVPEKSRDHGAPLVTPAQASTLLRDEMLKCGVLVGSGVSRDGEPLYAFLHRSVLDYLAACSYARQADADWPTVAAWVDGQSWLPARQEVITFLAGKLKDPAPLLNLLAEEPNDDIFARRRALAALCLPEVRRQDVPEFEGLVRRIAAGTFRLWFNNQYCFDTTRHVAHLSRALPGLAQINGTVPSVARLLAPYLTGTPPIPMADVESQEFSACLAELLTFPASQIRSVGLEALTWVGPVGATSKLLHALVVALRDPSYPGTELISGEWLSPLHVLGEAAATEEFLADLIETLREPTTAALPRVSARVQIVWEGRESTGVPELWMASAKYWVAAAVAAIGRAAATPVFVQSLHLIIAGDSDHFLQGWAIRTLAALGPVPLPDVVREDMLRHLQDQRSRSIVLEECGKLSALAADERFLEALVKLFGDPSLEVRKQAIEAFGRLVETARAYNQAFRLLPLQDEVEIRRIATKVYGGLIKAPALPEALVPLRDRLEDPDADVRTEAALALARLSEPATNPTFLDRMVLIYQASRRFDICRETIHWAVNGSRIDILLALTGELASESYLTSTFRVGWDLGSVLTEVLDWLESNQDEDRARSQESLKANCRAIFSLLSVLVRSEDREISIPALHLLLHVGDRAVTEAFIQWMVAQIQAPDENRRRAVISWIESLGGKVARRDEVISQLVRLLDDPIDTAPPDFPSPYPIYAVPPDSPFPYPIYVVPLYSMSVLLDLDLPHLHPLLQERLQAWLSSDDLALQAFALKCLARRGECVIPPANYIQKVCDCFSGTRTVALKVLVEAVEILHSAGLRLFRESSPDGSTRYVVKTLAELSTPST